MSGEFNFWQPYLIAIVIGLLCGVERERSSAGSKTMGVRTFTLLSLLGAIAAGLDNEWLAFLVALFALSLVVVSYHLQSRDGKSDRGLTTEFAAGIIFCLGFASHEAPTLAAVMGPVVAIVLFSKSSLHEFTRNLAYAELQAALFLLLAAVVVLNLVPDEVIDPWGVFNPRKFGFLILILAMIEFSSYVLAKAIGGSRSLYLTGFLAGLVSSTAVLWSSARQADKAPNMWRTQMASVLMAQVASLSQLVFILLVISPSVIFKTGPIIGASIAGVILALFILSRRNNEDGSELTMRSPLDWHGVFRLGIILGAILAFISFVRNTLGEEATTLVSFVAGLFELHGVSIANATVLSRGHLSVEAASYNINLAIVASFISKVAGSWIITRGPFSRGLTVIFIPLIALAAALSFAVHAGYL